MSKRARTQPTRVKAGALLNGAGLKLGFSQIYELTGFFPGGAAVDLIFPKSVAAIGKEQPRNYRLMTALIGEVCAQAGLQYRDLVLPWVEKEMASLRPVLRTEDGRVSRTEAYIKLLNAYLSDRKSLSSAEWLWVCVYNAVLAHHHVLDDLALACFTRLYRDDPLPSDQPDDVATSWSALFEGVARAPFNVINDPKKLRLIGEAHVGVYELLRFARSPRASETSSNGAASANKKPDAKIVRGAMEIYWPKGRSKYPVFRILYQSAQTEDATRLFESKGVVVPTQDCLYLIGSENDLHNLAILVLQNIVTNRSAPNEIAKTTSIRGIIVRRHSSNPIFAAKIFFRRTKSTNIEQERALVGYKAPDQIEEFDNIRKYILNTTNNKGESPISLD